MRRLRWMLQERLDVSVASSVRAKVDARRGWPGAKSYLAHGQALSTRQSARISRRCVGLTLLFAGGAALQLFSSDGLLGSLGRQSSDGGEGQPRRLGGCLSATEEEERKNMTSIFMVNKAHLTTSCPVKSGVCLRKDKTWTLPFYMIGMFYMFMALAIVCDEFFVPSLETFVDGFGISMDVAGATFMAAGGSMPELFTSMIGTFGDSEIGFAAIIGSAVFNVLFVIGVCAVASTEVLKLTWWPLARDCSFYIFSLGMLYFFLAVSKEGTESKIYAWHCVVLLLMYLCYCIFMKFNSQVEKFVKTNLLKQAPKIADESTIEEGNGCESEKNTHFLMPSSFRVGIVQLLTHNKSYVETAGMAAVTEITGNVKETFDKIDLDKNGVITDDEMKALLETLGVKPDSKRVREAVGTIDRRKTGVISFSEFSKWYLASEAKIEIEMRNIFDRFDVNLDGVIDKDEVGEVLKSLGHTPNKEDIDAAFNMMIGHVVDENVVEESVESGQASDDKACAGVTFDQFDSWYSSSLFWRERQRNKENNDDEDEEGGFSIDLPEDAGWACMAWYIASYPLCAMMYVTMPDVRRPKNQGSVKVACVEFVFSLIWIGFFTLCMVDWATVCSNTLGIPVCVAGLTLLAAGTSVPDLLSSYIVARQGEGDMAVSSSIGSNIFDILIGLPLPWLLYNLINGRHVVVGTQSLSFSVLVLMGMLMAVIGTIMVMNWRLTKTLGYVMFVLYAIFMIQALVQQLPEDKPLIAPINW